MAKGESTVKKQKFEEALERWPFLPKVFGFWGKAGRPGRAEDFHFIARRPWQNLDLNDRSTCVFVGNPQDDVAENVWYEVVWGVWQEIFLEKGWRIRRVPIADRYPGGEEEPQPLLCSTDPDEFWTVGETIAYARECMEGYPDHMGPSWLVAVVKTSWTQNQYTSGPKRVEVFVHPKWLHTMEDMWEDLQDQAETSDHFMHLAGAEGY